MTEKNKESLIILNDKINMYLNRIFGDYGFNSALRNDKVNKVSKAILPEIAKFKVKQIEHIFNKCYYESIDFSKFNDEDV